MRSGTHHILWSLGDRIRGYPGGVHTGTLQMIELSFQIHVFILSSSAENIVCLKHDDDGA